MLGPVFTYRPIVSHLRHQFVDRIVGPGALLEIIQHGQIDFFREGLGQQCNGFASPSQQVRGARLWPSLD